VPAAVADAEPPAPPNPPLPPVEPLPLPFPPLPPDPPLPPVAVPVFEGSELVALAVAACPEPPAPPGRPVVPLDPPLVPVDPLVPVCVTVSAKLDDAATRMATRTTKNRRNGRREKRANRHALDTRDRDSEWWLVLGSGIPNPGNARQSSSQ